MIQPLIPYALAGTIWYQGESNSSAAQQYKTTFPMMIKDWRQRWGQGDFPFYYCQLANIDDYAKVPGDSQWAELREAQTSALALPNTGQAILIDIGEHMHAAVHPTDKVDVGNRLALIALAKTYGKQVSYSGPMFDSMTVEGDKIRLKFKYTDGGLVAKPIPATYQPLSSNPATKPLVRNVPDSQLEGFAICGDDHKWQWANATIDGTDVVVSAAAVPKPIAVRYDWADDPICNLYNGAGLPACPFRTDDFPGISVDKY
jgi:sialate O-acetylesterase